MNGKLWSFVALIALSLQLWPSPVVSHSLPDPRFGMTEAFWQPEEAAELGVGWERILFYWRELQPDGPDDWNTLHVLEEWLDEADAQGRTVVGLLKNTAPWASEDGTEAGLPKGLYLDIDDPENLWASFVRRTADYYGERGVTNWIIWNEPDIKPGVYGYEFAGDLSDYYQLVKVAYKVIKEEQPEAVIHLAGLTWWHDQSFLDRLIAQAANDPEAKENGYFFDVISLHIYFRTETIPVVLNAVNRIQEKYGLDKPIWINETNAPPNQDPKWPVNRPNFEIDLEQQAWFIVQAFALGFASGAESISVYKLIDIHLAPGDESFGLLRPDLSRRPAFEAYKTAAKTMHQFIETRLERTDAYFQVTFERPQGTTRVLWTRTPKSVTLSIPAVSNQASLFDVDGQETHIYPDQGKYLIRLDGARCGQECLVGGPPLILVEPHPGYSPKPRLIEGKLLNFMAKSAEEVIPKIAAELRLAPLVKSADTEQEKPIVHSQNLIKPTLSPRTTVDAIDIQIGKKEPLSVPQANETELPISIESNASNEVEQAQSSWMLWTASAVSTILAAIGLIVVIRGKSKENI